MATCRTLIGIWTISFCVSRTVFWNILEIFLELPVVPHKVVMEWLLPSLQGWSRKSGLVPRGGFGEVRKGLMGSLCAHCPETNQPATLTRASRTEGGMNTKVSWPSTQTRCLERYSPRASRPRRIAGSSRTPYGATDRMAGFGRTIYLHRTNMSPWR